jgi:DNA uptake protein ComE-like DNA-binding protein
MNSFKSYFWYTNRQRNGILFLVFIVIILQLIFFFVDFSKPEPINLNTEEIIKIQKEIDSLKLEEIENTKPKIFPFNPSFLTDHKGYQLGMSTDEIDRLLSHRAQGNYINSTEEFQEITMVSDSLLNAISPYFKFPDWVQNQKTRKKFSTNIKNSEEDKNYVQQDLNSATGEDLMVVKGIGPALAQRIIKYRNLLNGYSMNDQLYEVWNLEKEVADRVLERFIVIEKPNITKINVNTASFKEVLSIVYIDYELTKKIFDYRDEVAELQSLEELKQIEGFPIEKFDRIALYLQAK